MLRPIAALLLVVLVLGLAGCDNGAGVIQIPLGGLLIEVIGDRVRISARVGFVDGLGSPVPPPPSGAVVIISGPGVITAGVDPAQGDTVVGRAVGTDNLGVIDTEIVGLSLQSAVPIRVGAPGFLPINITVPPGATSLPAGTLVLHQDPNPSPTQLIQNTFFQRGQDGVLRLCGSVPEHTDVVVFRTQGIVTDVGELNALGGVDGPLQRTQVAPGGPGISSFTAELPATIPTGRLFICASQWDDEFQFKAYGTCGLSLANYTRGGSLVSGTINGPGGGAAGGAEIIVFEEGNGSNSGATTTAGNGNFSAGLGTAPTGNNVTVQAQWTDPATGITWVCAWSGLP